MDTLARWRWTIIGVLVSVAAASSLVALVLGDQAWDALLLNFGTEMAGAMVTHAHRRQEAFFEGHVAAFEWFGAIPISSWFSIHRLAIGYSVAAG